MKTLTKTEKEMLARASFLMHAFSKLPTEEMAISLQVEAFHAHVAIEKFLLFAELFKELKG